MENNGVKDDKKDKNDKEETSVAVCNRCGFSAPPEEFEPCLSPYHDLRCPECGTTDVDWTNGSYVDNNLSLT